MPNRNQEKNKVLYIGGFGRSGSTLLARMLGQIPGFFPVGEPEYVWESYFAENQSCGCGAAFRECGFWGAVVEEAYGAYLRNLAKYSDYLGRFYAAIRKVSGSRAVRRRAVNALTWPLLLRYGYPVGRV